MSLSKLQKLDPSAIDNCPTVWSLIRLWHVKKEEIKSIFITPLRNLQTRAAFIAPFTSEE
jgi:hypothetical protein